MTRGEDARGGNVRLLCGPHGSGRASAIDALMREHWGRALLLVPTRKYAQKRIEQLILDSNLPGLWGRAVLTLQDFAAELLRSEGRAPVLVGDFERKKLFEQALARLQGRPSLARVGAAGETQGFLSQMLRVITELKQAAIEPAEFRRRAGGNDSKNWLDPLVADVYEEYQDAILKAGIYDVPGMFWEGNVICRKRRPQYVRDVDFILLDGFDDFTPSEFNLLVSLRPHVCGLVFGINCDNTPNRRDLYACPLRTALKIQQEFGAPVEQFEAPAPLTYTEHAAASIFWRDAPMAAGPELRPDLELLPCADLVQEVETIGRRIKDLLLQGVPAGEIAVVYASVTGSAATVRSVFSEFGIPLRMVHPMRLWESSVGAFALALLEALDEWARETVVDVLTSPWFCPGRPYSGAIATLARAAAIISGRQEWQRRLEFLAETLKRATPELAPLKKISTVDDALQSLARDVEKLAALDDGLASKASPQEHIGALKRLLAELDVEQNVLAYCDEEVRGREAAAFAALMKMLDTWRTWTVDAAPVSRKAFAAELRRALQENQFVPPQPTDGVLFLDAQALRHLQFDYVFLAGANEGAFPGPGRVNAVYSEHDVANLARAGIELEGRHAHVEREMLLFNHILCASRRQLVITWHTLSSRGQEAHPSPYIADLIELFPAESFCAPAPYSNQFVPPLELAASWRDVRNAAFVTTSDAPELQAKFPATERAAAIETARHDVSPFGVYDGVLSHGGIVETLSQRFGEGHLFSVNQLEMYAACPFRFLVRRVLGLDVIEAPDAQFDAIIRGNIIHDVLQQFHMRYRLAPPCEIPEGEAAAALEELVEQTFQKRGWRSVNSPPAVLNVEKRYVLRLVLRYLHNQREKCETEWQPSRFEVAFGKAHDEADTQPFRLELAEGSILFSGRIDRIDAHGTNSRFARIIDYKTSFMPRAKDVIEGRSLQLAVYALALEEMLMPECTCEEALFLSIKKNERRTLPRAKTCGQRDVLCTTIDGYVKGIRKAVFPPTPGDADNACGLCAAKRVCRYERGRVARKGGEA